jgi:hypothetical protein
MAVLVTGAFLSVGGFSTATQAQNVQAQPAVQDASVKPIGKVITAAGLVTIEHVSAVIVQASLGNQPGQAKIGDPIYLGDVLSTGSDGRVGITFADGTAFDLSSNARMTMTEFIYDPNSKSNSSLLSLTKGTFTFVAGKIVVYKHALKNALIPVVTIVGGQLGVLLAGTVVVETIFALPGMGRLTVEAILYRDYPVVQTNVMLVAGTLVTLNLLVDMTYAWLDPRIRYQ